MKKLFFTTFFMLGYSILLFAQELPIKSYWIDTDKAGRQINTGVAKERYKEDSEGNITGKYISYHRNGNKSVVADYLNGKKDGKYEEYSESGEIKLRCFYKSDILNGQYLEVSCIGFWGSGNCYTITGNYLNNKLDGLYIEKKTSEIRSFFGLGASTENKDVLISKGNYVKGYKVGKWFENGQDDGSGSEGNYVDGKYDGEWINSFFDKGLFLYKKGYKVIYKNGNVVASFDDKGNNLTEAELNIKMDKDWQSANTKQDYIKFLNNYPTSSKANEAKAIIKEYELEESENALFLEATNDLSVQKLKNFQLQYPNSKFLSTALDLENFISDSPNVNCSDTLYHSLVLKNNRTEIYFNIFSSLENCKKVDDLLFNNVKDKTLIEHYFDKENIKDKRMLYGYVSVNLPESFSIYYKKEGGKFKEITILGNITASKVSLYYDKGILQIIDENGRYANYVNFYKDGLLKNIIWKDELYIYSKDGEKIYEGSFDEIDLIKLNTVCEKDVAKYFEKIFFEKRHVYSDNAKEVQFLTYINIQKMHPSLKEYDEAFKLDSIFLDKYELNLEKKEIIKLNQYMVFNKWLLNDIDGLIKVMKPCIEFRLSQYDNQSYKDLLKDRLSMLKSNGIIFPNEKETWKLIKSYKLSRVEKEKYDKIFELKHNRDYWGEPNAWYCTQIKCLGTNLGKYFSRNSESSIDPLNNCLKVKNEIFEYKNEDIQLMRTYALTEFRLFFFYWKLEKFDEAIAIVKENKSLIVPFSDGSLDFIIYIKRMYNAYESDMPHSPSFEKQLNLYFNDKT